MPTPKKLTTNKLKASSNDPHIRSSCWWPDWIFVLKAGCLIVDVALILTSVINPPVGIAIAVGVELIAEALDLRHRNKIHAKIAELQKTHKNK